MTKWPHTAAILAGGQSRRMGGMRKESLPLADGRVMIEHVRDALSAHCERIVIVGETDALPDLPRVHDLRPPAGPLGGIEALLASGLDDQFLVCPCDVPRISTEVIAILTTATDQPATTLRIEGEDSPRPLPARLHVSLLPMVREQLDAGRNAVRDFMKKVDARIVEIPASAADALVNVNTPDDAMLLEPPRDAR